MKKWQSDTPNITMSPLQIQLRWFILVTASQVDGPRDVFTFYRTMKKQHYWLIMLPAWTSTSSFCGRFVKISSCPSFFSLLQFFLGNRSNRILLSLFKVTVSFFMISSGFLHHYCRSINRGKKMFQNTDIQGCWTLSKLSNLKAALLWLYSNSVLSTFPLLPSAVL